MIRALGSKATLSFIALTACVALNTISCSSPGGPEGPTTRTYHVTFGSGDLYTLTVDPSLAFAYKLDNVSALPAVHTTVTGTCTAPTVLYNVQSCTAAASDNPDIPVGSTIKFKDIPGLFLYLSVKKPSDIWAIVPEGVIQKGLPYFETSDSGCNPVEQDYTNMGITNSFGVSRFSSTLPALRDASFSLFAVGSTFGSSYQTSTVYAGSINISSIACQSGVRDMQVLPSGGGSPSDVEQFNMDSGMTYSSGSFGAPKPALVTSLDQLAGKSFDGLVFNPGSADSFELTLGARIGNTVSETTWNSSAGSTVLQGLSLLSMSDPAAGARFSTPVDLGNPLSAKYAAGNAIPGLYYAPFSDGSGNEQPAIILAANSAANGKTILIGVTTQRTGPSLGAGHFFVAEEK